ncbi:MAG: NUDIX hydrolase [Dehalococcoidia bacterium]|jgi:ADP-ribose pyrophosphatase|nr:NUDIX hydrolase [Dehalococcoidia bacterium]
MEQRISSTQVYSGPAITVRIDKVRKPNGTTTTRDVVEHSDCVVIVPLDTNNNVLLVKQFRYPIDADLLELPAGGIEPGEDAVDCVHRELQEETGFDAGSIEKLGGFYSIPGYGTEYLYAYAASDLTPSRLVAEDTDEIEVVKVPLRQALDLIQSGKICDAKSIAALLMYLARAGTTR